MEEEPVMVVPDPEKLENEQQNFIIEQEDNNPQRVDDAQEPVKPDVAEKQPTEHDEFSLDDITAVPQEKTREEIIAEAEAAAFAD